MFSQHVIISTLFWSWVDTYRYNGGLFPSPGQMMYPPAQPAAEFGFDYSDNGDQISRYGAPPRPLPPLIPNNPLLSYPNTPGYPSPGQGYPLPPTKEFEADRSVAAVPPGPALSAVPPGPPASAPVAPATSGQGYPLPPANEFAAANSVAAVVPLMMPPMPTMPPFPSVPSFPSVPPFPSVPSGPPVPVSPTTGSCNCGVNTEDYSNTNNRIINGEEADPHEFPWQVICSLYCAVLYCTVLY